MKFKCECSHVIVDQTDDLSYKGYIVPDKEWFNLLDAIDEAVEKSGPSSRDKEAALMKVRSMANRISRVAYQCPKCGRLHLCNDSGALHTYEPASNSISKIILDA